MQGPRLKQPPFLVVSIGLVGVFMLLPAAYAATLEDWRTARTFTNTFILVEVITFLLALATTNQRAATQGRIDLLLLLISFLLLPAVMAIPFYESLGTGRFLDAYFEMISAFTTTGATLFAPEALTQPLHLWRATCAWMGGFLMWVSALAIFAPLLLGGYEVHSQPFIRRDIFGHVDNAPLTKRMWVLGGKLLPIYLGGSVLLFGCLIGAGNRTLEAAIIAMGTISTSGIMLDGDTGQGRISEVFILVFFVLALSRVTFDPPKKAARLTTILRDREIRLAALIIAVATVIAVAYRVVWSWDDQSTIAGIDAGATLWGALFTSVSFLSTTGFPSGDWPQWQGWADDLSPPILMLIALPLIGGGVATTAGGIKLLRIYSLMRHGEHELERLVHPSSVVPLTHANRYTFHKGAYIAWVFFMLFTMSVALFAVTFASMGQDFEDALVFTISALTNTGPLVGATGDPLAVASLSDIGKTIYAAAAIIGRLETLAFVAMLNPDFWRS